MTLTVDERAAAVHVIEARRPDGAWTKVTTVQDDLVDDMAGLLMAYNAEAGYQQWRIAEPERTDAPADPLPERPAPKRERKPFPFWTRVRFRLLVLFSPRARA